MAASLKFVFVGDSFVGKTCYLYSYLNGEYPPGLTPSTIGFAREVERLEDSHIEFYDTAGSYRFASIRINSYPRTDVFLVCFAVNNRSSFDNVSSEWLPEIREAAGSKIPTVLVGLKADLRNANASKDDADESVDPICATRSDHNESADNDIIFPFQDSNDVELLNDGNFQASVTQDHDNKSIKTSCVTQKEALNLVKIEKMFAYVECSAIMGIGCQEPIKKAMEAAEFHRTNKSKESKCCLI